MSEGLAGAAATPGLLPAGGKQIGAAAAAATQLPTSLLARPLTGSLTTGGLAARSAALGVLSAQPIQKTPTCLLTRYTSCLCLSPPPVPFCKSTFLFPDFLHSPCHLCTLQPLSCLCLVELSPAFGLTPCRLIEGTSTGEWSRSVVGAAV